MKNDERQIVLSVFWNGPKHFIVQTTPDVNKNWVIRIYDIVMSQTNIVKTIDMLVIGTVQV